MTSSPKAAASAVEIREPPMANDLEMFTAADNDFDSDECDSDAERVLGHSDDEFDDDDDLNVTVDDDYKPPGMKIKKRSNLSRSQYSNNSSNSDLKKEDHENSKDIKYVEGKEKPWVCKNCNRNYKWKNSLKCHLKNECGLPPKYFCSRDCGYKTNVHSNLKRHLNSKFCKSRDPPGEEATMAAAVPSVGGTVITTTTPHDIASAATMEVEPEVMEPLLTVIKDEPVD